MEAKELPGPRLAADTGELRAYGDTYLHLEQRIPGSVAQQIAELIEEVGCEIDFGRFSIELEIESGDPLNWKIATLGRCSGYANTFSGPDQ